MKTALFWAITTRTTSLITHKYDGPAEVHMLLEVAIARQILAKTTANVVYLNCFVFETEL